MKPVWTLTTALAVLAAPIAWASLEHASASETAVVAESTVPAATAQVVQRSMPQDLQVRSANGPNGAAVHEYIAADGTLFAVTWTGPHPVTDSQIANAFFSQSGPSSHRAHDLQLVVHSDHQPWGYRGVAYAPALMPLDFDPHTLAP